MALAQPTAASSIFVFKRQKKDPGKLDAEIGHPVSLGSYGYPVDKNGPVLILPCVTGGRDWSLDGEVRQGPGLQVSYARQWQVGLKYWACCTTPRVAFLGSRCSTLPVFGIQDTMEPRLTADRCGLGWIYFMGLIASRMPLWLTGRWNLKGSPIRCFRDSGRGWLEGLCSNPNSLS